MAQRGRPTPNRVSSSAGGEKCSCQIDRLKINFSYSWSSVLFVAFPSHVPPYYCLAGPLPLLSILDVAPH